MALKIGKTILCAINKMQIDKNDFGQELVVPFKLPNLYNEPSFIYSVKVQMPRFTQINSDGSFLRSSSSSPETAGRPTASSYPRGSGA